MFESLFSERGLSLDRLKALMEVAQAGSIAQAVKGDYVRQSQYSRQIKELEEFFGTPLTHRKGKVLVLTKEGQELVRLIRESFYGLDDFKNRYQKTFYRYSIGSGDSNLAWVVAPALSRIAKEKRPWLFTLQNLRNSEVSQQLQDMDLDFGILKDSALPSQLLEKKTILKVDYALYVPKSLLPPRQKKDFAHLVASLPLATLASETSFYSSLHQKCKEHGIRLNVQCETQSFPFALRMLQSGHYMAILPCIAESDLNDSFLKVTHPSLDVLSRTLTLAWNPRLLRMRPEARHVIDFFAGSCLQKNTPHE